nr:glycosyltransferase family 2 protein [Candidatus Gracilibacteria bacterium]
MKISFILPIYNESGNIKELYSRIINTINNLSCEYELVFINDASKDNSLDLLIELSNSDKNVKTLNFSRNFGHQIAITAGLDYANGDIVVIMDTDLQDPPEIIPEMLAKYNEGYKVIYAKRRTRKDSFFKKITAKMFYRILRKLSNIDIPLDTGDFRMMDRDVVEQMKKIREHSRFMRGITSWIGFKQTFVEFDRDERKYGVTNYPLSKMLKFALDGITSFSYKPLKIATYTGFMTSFFAFVYALYIVISYFFLGKVYEIGWPTIILAIMFFGGLQLIILGIIGEYIGRIYTETQNRPLYIISDIYNNGKNN